MSEETDKSAQEASQPLADQEAHHDAPPAQTPAQEPDLQVEQQLKRLTRAGFLGMGVSLILGALGFGWLWNQKSSQGIPWPLRKMHEFNENLSQLFFDSRRLAPTFAKAQAKVPRINGKVGLLKPADLRSWRLEVQGLPASALQRSDPVRAGQQLELTMEEIHTLPHQEVITELKCIEGWSQVVHWGGVRFADFVARYYPELAQNTALVPYVGMQTPDGKYYIGLDMPSALHPQTLLCYELDGKPLSLEHGAPLRLVIPLKYGIKHIKGLGRIVFSQQRPPDYWAERGYDWYSGH